MKTISLKFKFIFFIFVCSSFNACKRPLSDAQVKATPRPENRWERLPHYFYEQMLYDRFRFHWFGDEYSITLQISVTMSSLMPHFRTSGFYDVQASLHKHFQEHVYETDPSSFQIASDIYDVLRKEENFLKNGLTDDDFLSIIYRDVVTYRVLTSRSQQEVTALLHEVKDRWDFQQKIIFTKMIGGRFSLLYDDARAEANLSDQSVRTTVDMLDSFRKGNPTGICRDIAAAQASLLHDMGVPNSYVLGYVTGSGHAVVITQNPDKPSQLIKIDYTRGSESTRGFGTQALYQFEDISNNYQIWRPVQGGTKFIPVAQLPSEAKIAIMQGFSRDTESVDFYATRFSPYTAQASLNFKGTPGLKFTTMSTRLDNQSELLAIGPAWDWGDPNKDIAAGQGMLIFLHRTPPAGQSINAYVLSTMYTQYLNSTWAQLGKKVKMRVESKYTAEGFGGGGQRDRYDEEVREVVKKGYIIGDGSLLAQGGIAFIADINEQNELKFRSFTQFALGNKDARQAFSPTFFHNLSVSQLVWTHKLPKLTLRHEINIGFRDFGPQGEVSSACEFRDKSSIKVGYQNAIGPNNIGIAPGASSLLYVQGEIKAFPWMSVGCDLGYNPDSGVKGGAIVKINIGTGSKRKSGK